MKIKKNWTAQKWMLFTKSVDVIALDKKDMAALEGMRDETWNEKKKHFGL